MIKAFVFGKFLPFHQGHEAMIRFALSKCDYLSILICCSDKENISGSVRQNWITQSFGETDNIDISVFNYREDDLPNTSVSSKDVSEIWSNTFKKLFADYNLLVTSEPYGAYVAEFMQIQHIPFDIPRSQYPVSATAIRNDIFTNWKYLPNSVKPYFAIKVVILGTESTGKSTLAMQLAQHFHAGIVTEAGRDLIKDSNVFSLDDLVLVAQTHAKRIQSAIQGDSPLVIIDTDIHITQSYARSFFNTEIEVPQELYELQKADLYFYLNNDVEYVQDGTRLAEAARNLLDISHRQVLSDYKIDFIEISGTWSARFEQAVGVINNFLHPRPQQAQSQ